MSKGDVPVWLAFYRAKKKLYFGYRYDVRVGSQAFISYDAPEWLKADAIALSMKRIDVVFEDSENIYITEVKPRITPYTLGQVLTYATLFSDQYKPEKSIVATIIASQVDPDVMGIAQQQGVQIFLVNPQKYE